MAKSTTRITVILELTQEEALWLKEETQNSPMAESDPERIRIRQSIFHTLPNFSILQ